MERRILNIVLLGGVCGFFLLGCVFIYSKLKSDNVVSWAWETNPLDGKHVYIIEKNNAFTADKEKQSIPAGISYIMRRPEENNNIYFNISGRAIGKTGVDLIPYLGKEVYIIGEYYEGDILFLTPVSFPEYMCKSVVVYIKSLTLKKR